MKILANIAGVAVGCLAVHQATGGGGVDWKALGIGVGMCVLSNLIGLGQHPPDALRFSDPPIKR